MKIYNRMSSLLHYKIDVYIYIYIEREREREREKESKLSLLFIELLFLRFDANICMYICAYMKSLLL